MPWRSTMGVRTRPMRITCRMLVSGRACHPPNDSLGGLSHRLGDERGRLLQGLRTRGRPLSRPRSRGTSGHLGSRATSRATRRRRSRGPRSGATRPRRRLSPRRPRAFESVVRVAWVLVLHVGVPAFIAWLPTTTGMRLRDFADFYPEQAADGGACAALLAASGLAKLCGGVGSRAARD